jgi:hypothetical protein
MCAFVCVTRRNPEVAVQMAMRLGESYCSAVAGFRVMVLAGSTSQKTRDISSQLVQEQSLFPQ